MPRTSIGFPAVEMVPEVDTFTPHLDELMARAANLVPAWSLVYAAFLAIEGDRFHREGPGWESLATSTQQQRARLGIGAAHPILDRSGAGLGTLSRKRKTYGKRGVTGRRGGSLKASLTNPTARGAIFEPGVDGVVMGTSDPIAGYHQDGTSRMPARPVIDLTDSDAAVFGELVGSYLFDGLATGVLAAAGVFAGGPVGL